MVGELRAELASVVASLGAYLEVARDAGAWGIPRGPSPAATGTAAVSGEPEHALPIALAGLAMPSRSSPGATAPASARTASPAPVRSLDVLEREVSACTRCALHTTRTKTAFARGNPAATLCFIGEAPGEDEDLQGKPFVGRAGKLLDRMIAAMGLVPETDVYVCNIIKCRPPENRRPTPAETETCIGYLHEQLANVKPKVIVLLGNTAVAALLRTKIGITKLRGEWKLYGGSTLVMPTYHPSYLLRPSAAQAQAKREAWEDLQKVMKELGLAHTKT